MRELLDYLETLRSRGLALSLRELRSRFIRGPVKTAVRRVMDACEAHEAVFTFFITGNCAEANKDFIREILDRGHAISCHGYRHLRFDRTDRTEALEDILHAKRIFLASFAYRLDGFRAPYLGMNEQVAEYLADAGLTYSSSVMAYAVDGASRIHYRNGLPEFPIVACDWHSLIRDNIGADAFTDELCSKAVNGAVFELHPWRMGQKANIDILERFLATNTLPGISLARLAQGEAGIALTGDLGELGLMEIFKRLLVSAG